MNEGSALFKIGYNTTAQFLGKILSASLSAVSIILLTRYLGVSGYGDFSLIFVYLTFFVAFSDFGLQTTIVNQLSKKTIREEEIFGTYFALKAVLIILAIAASLFVLIFLPYSDFVKNAIIFSSVGIGIGAFGGFGNTFFQYNLRLDISALIDVINRFITVGLIFIFIILKLNFFFIISSVLISNLISMILMFFLLRKFVKFKFEYKNKIALNLIKISLPVGIAYYLATSYFKLDVLMLSVFRKSTEVGIYSLAYKIFENAMLLWVFLMASFFPVLSRLFHSKRKEEYKSLVRKTFFSSLVFSALVIFFGFILAPFLVRIFGGSDFNQSILPLRILIFATAFASVNLILFNVLFINGKIRYILISLFFALIFNFVINLLVIPRFGYVGASISTVATEGVLLASYLLFGLRDFRRS